MRWSPHAALNVTLALEAAGLTIAGAWAHGIPIHLCDEGVRRPSSWIYAGIVLFGVSFSAVVLLGTMATEENPTLQQIYVGLALAGTIAAILIAIYLNGKYSHYHCG
jgi:hypothetical protein